jgi:Xaa-Pro aminopeptidase
MLLRDLASRISRLAQSLTDSGGDVFFASNPTTMEYLQGFGEDGFERFLSLAVRSTGEVVLICPALSATKARRCGIADVRTWNDSEDPLQLFRGLADEWNLRSAIIYVDGFMPAMMVLAMQEALPAALFKSGQTMIAGLMRKKDENELALMRKAGSIADNALAPALKQLKSGMTELQFGNILKGEMEKLGGKPTFCIIATGPNSAEPHHENDNTPIREGNILLCDYGCSVDGYNSDITRVVNVGTASEETRRVYGVVYEAQRLGRARIKAGIPAEEIDRATRDVIEKSGYGEFFIHRTGHGIGMREHEEPNIVQGATTPLEVGECFSVEPGIYLPGKFGVRIENIVTPTDDGHESMNAEPSATLTEIELL